METIYIEEDIKRERNRFWLSMYFAFLITTFFGLIKFAAWAFDIDEKVFTYGVLPRTFTGLRGIVDLHRLSIITDSPSSKAGGERLSPYQQLVEDERRAYLINQTRGTQTNFFPAHHLGLYLSVNHKMVN